MLLKLFKGTGFHVIFLLIITLAALWAGAFLHPQKPPLAIFEIRPMPLYGLLKGLVAGSQFAGTLLVFLIVCLMLFLLVNFNTSQFFINERTFLPALFYTLFISFFPACQVLNPVLPASIFLILALRRIIDSYRVAGIAYNFFDAGILIGVGTLFYADLIWFGILLIAGIILFRTISFTELILSLLGLATPLILSVGLFYVLGKDIWLFIDDIRDNLFERVQGFPFTRMTVVLLIYSGLVLIVTAGFLIVRLSTKKIKSRKTFSLLLWTLLLAFSAFLALPSISTEIIWIASIPACYLMAHYFVFEKKRIFSEITFSLLVVFVFLVQALWFFK
jgi:hypothetical protein